MEDTAELGSSRFPWLRLMGESQQRRTEAARDSSVGEVVLHEELGEHVLLFEAKILVESTPCWSR